MSAQPETATSSGFAGTDEMAAPQGDRRRRRARRPPSARSAALTFGWRGC